MFKVRKTLYLTLVATLAAVSAVCNAYLFIPTPVNGVAVSFAYIPALVAGALLGPLAGGTVGFVGDLIGVLIRPVNMGPYNPIIGVANALLGFIPGFIFKELRLKKLKSWTADIIRIFISFVLTFIICTASLNTYAMYIQYGLPNGKSFWTYFSLRLPWQSLVVAINLVSCIALFPLIKYAFEKVFRPKYKNGALKHIDDKTQTSENEQKAIT